MTGAVCWPEILPEIAKSAGYRNIPTPLGPLEIFEVSRFSLRVQKHTTLLQAAQARNAVAAVLVGV
ncbi:MAG TPA: hypothetical protein VN517_10275 [Terriglobales bacterium]|nr:hypothetical protein [Terriglobales bacterium]